MLRRATLVRGIGGAVRPATGAKPSTPLEPSRPPTAQQLLLDALDAPASRRSDLDLAVVRQYLASLDAFGSVAPAVLHYISMECFLTRIPDGEVLCYQEDFIDDSSCAYVVIEGSLCGYYNKVFAQRNNTAENFSEWNQRQGKGRDLVIEFGELQTTFRKNDLCCFDDFFSASKAASAIHRACYRKGIHAQEHTLLLSFAKDTLERAVRRFGLSYHQNVLSSPKLSGNAEYCHIAPLSLLSYNERALLLQSARRERPNAGTVIFSSRESEALHSEGGFLIVTQGSLDISLCSNTRPVTISEAETEQGKDNQFPPIENFQNESMQVISSIRKGLPFGDQTIALCKCSMWSNAVISQMQSTRMDWFVRVIVAEPGVEIIWISKVLYDFHIREDRLRFAYVPFSLLETDKGMTKWAIGRRWNEYSSSQNDTSVLRNDDETSRLQRLVMANANLSHFFSQLPPVAIERFTQCLQIRSFASNSRIVNAGDTVSHLLIVAEGSLVAKRLNDKNVTPSQIESPKLRLGTAEWYNRGLLIPGDAFGAHELSQNYSAALHSVDTNPGTVILYIPQQVFRRWLYQSELQLEFLPGSALHHLALAASPSKARSEIRKLSTSVATRHSMMSQTSPPSPTRPITGILISSTIPNETVSLLQRLGILDDFPTHIRAQLLPFATLVRKSAGEIILQEMDEKKVLIVLISGFITIYSREHLAAAAEMLHNHPFCRYASFFASNTSPEDYADAMSLEVDQGERDGSKRFHIGHSLSKHHHRSGFHGLHIHTLPPLSALRSGVLHDGGVCPGTVIAQTDCEYLVIDEDTYNHVVTFHRPFVNFNTENEVDTRSDQNSQESIPEDTASAAKTTAILKSLDDSATWRLLSPAKRQLAARSMRQVVLPSGHQLLAAGDLISDMVFVVSGRLNLYVRQNQEAATIRDAREQTMKSLTLERSVASNYATTSQQLYSDEDDKASASGSSSRQRLLHKGDSIAIRRQLSRITRDRSTERGIFVDSVMAAIEEERFKRQTSKLRTNENTNLENQRGISVVPLLHSAIHRASIDRKLSLHRAGRRASTHGGHRGRNRQDVFLCHLNSGDVYGEEVLSSSGLCLTSKHDIYAETTSCPSGHVGQDLSSSGRIELLCLDRRVFLSILAKSEEDVENELRMRSVIVRSKWRRAGKDVAVAKRLQPMHPPGVERDSSGRPEQTATPKLLTLFQNLVNQRFHLTTRAIADIPLLRTLPESAKREICLVAKFETLDRRPDLPSFSRLGANNNEDSKKSDSSFFIVLSGRVGLMTKHYHPHSVAPSSFFNPIGGGLDCGQFLREITVGDGFGEFDIFVPGVPRSVYPVAIESAKMLSIPAAMFVKYWPHARQMRDNIEYLRTQIPLFAGLPIDRLAQLYNIVEFRSFIRGNTIFDLSDESSRASALDKICFVKAGTCCIHREIVIEPPVLLDRDYSEENAKITNKRVKAKTSIANVSSGHFFWLHEHSPFISLEAISASVSVAIFPIDRLKSILPRSYLVKIESFRNQLEALHQKEVQVAQQALVALIKEMTLATSRIQEVTIKAPPITPISTSRQPFLSVIPRNRGMASASPSKNADITTASNLPSREPARQPGQQILSNRIHQVNDSATEFWPPFFASNHHSPHHVQEHYHPGVDLVDLAGSFVGDACFGDNTTESTLALKEDQLSNVEHVHPPKPLTPRRSGRCAESSNTQLLSFSVNIPRVSVDVPALTVNGLPASCRPRTPGITPPRPLLYSRSESPSWRLNIDGAASSLVACLESSECVDVNDHEWLWLEIDFRSKIAAQLADFSSPMRMISLKPCRPTERKCTDWSPRPNDIEHHKRNEEMEISTLFPVLASHPALKGKAKGRNNYTNSPQRREMRFRQPEIVSKQGFLEIAGTLLAGHWTSTNGRRRYFVLVGRELREFADTVALYDLSNEQHDHCYTLYTESKVLHAAGDAFSLVESVRTQSFMLRVDSSASLVLTAPSQIERKQWMAALTSACSYQGDNIKASYPSAKKIEAPPREGISPFHRKRTAGQPKVADDDLPVEYCIS